MNLLVTGGSGFIGSNLVRHLLASGDDHVVNLDKLTYSGNAANLTDIETNPRYRFVRGCITDPAVVEPLIRGADAVFHLAAESHVDRSIEDARPFVTTNVLGTMTLLDALRRDPNGSSKTFVHVSTDEVFGDLPLSRPDLRFHEETPYAPSSPYAASKAGSDLLAHAYHRTFGLDVRITNCSNNFGPYQHPEKVIPLFITNLLRGRKVPLYGDGQNVRDWLHVQDHCEALRCVLERGRPGERYCIGGDNERSNLELTHTLLELMGFGDDMIQPVEDRPGHDRRYAIDSGKIRVQLGWRPSRSRWPAALADTVSWYRDHRTWWEPLLHPAASATHGPA